MHAATTAEALGELSRRFSGELLRDGDPGYDEVRRVHNGLIDKRPALIARCRSAADVAEAVRFGRESGLEMAIRGGGHNVAGRSTVEGGLLLDLSLMRSVRVDQNARMATAEVGATWGEFNQATQAYGLATTGGDVSTTGIAGLTLGGGIGWLMGKCGLTVDNLMSVEIVTADGQIRTASAAEDSDLFWALRGGGGNFGVVTSFVYRLHPVGPSVVGGMVLHPLRDAASVLRLFRERTASLPDELTLAAGLLHAPDGAKLAGILACHCGDPAEGEPAVRPIKAFGSPVVDALGPMSFMEVTTMLDAGFPKGALNYWKSSFLEELSDEAIEILVSVFERCPSPMTVVVLDHVHGAAARVPVDATAFPHRGDGYSLLLLSQWQDPADTERNLAWTRETYAVMEPFFAEGRYVNYLDRDDSGGAVAAAYGPNLSRLRQIKAQYDPENVFHMNQNIRPA